MIELKYSKGEVEITAYQDEGTGQLFLTLDGLAALFGKDRSNLAKQAKAIAGQSWQSWQNFAMIPSGERRYRKAVYGLDVIRSIAESRGSEEGLAFCQWAATLARPSGDNALEKAEFIEGNSKIEVLVSPEEETVWLTQEQIAELFETSRTNVVEHIQNIYSQEEVERSSTCRFFRQVVSNGKRYNMPFYNLDMVLAIGYRVNSKRGIAFRKWASSVLKEKLRKERAVPVEGVSSAFETNVMRLISSFAPPKEQVASLQQAVIHLDNRVSEAEKRLGNWSEEHILYEGKPFLGMTILQSIFKRAKHQIVWIDPYADEATLRFLSYCPSKRLPIRIYLGNPKQFDVTKADDFKPNIKVLSRFFTLRPSMTAA